MAEKYIRPGMRTGPYKPPEMWLSPFGPVVKFDGPQQRAADRLQMNIEDEIIKSLFGVQRAD